MKYMVGFIVLCLFTGCGTSSTYNPNYVITQSPVEEFALPDDEEAITPELQ